MSRWGKLPPDEVERRREASLMALRDMEREAFRRWYQEQCDRDYWSRGQCCAGCDFWESDMGNLGTCAAAGIVPGADVMRSVLGNDGFCSYTPEPGLPWTPGIFWCGKFKDEFDWQSLGEVYLTRIGAMRNGRLRPRPAAPEQIPPAS